MLPVPSKAASGATKIEKCYHVVRVDKLEALHLKVVRNVGEVELQALLFGIQIRAQDRIVEIALDEGIKRAGRDGQGFWFGPRTSARDCY
jgi:hypothetical protein